MIACKDLDEQLLDLLYDELPTPEASAAQQHLQGCARCRGQLASFRRVREAARALPVAEPGDALSARLMAEATRHLVERAPVARPEMAAAAAAATLSIVGRTPSGQQGGAARLAGRARLYRVFTHPAFAVAATVVVVVGAAQYVYPVHRAAQMTSVVVEGPAEAPVAPEVAEAPARSREPSSAPLLVPPEGIAAVPTIGSAPGHAAPGSSLGAAASPAPSFHAGPSPAAGPLADPWAHRSPLEALGGGGGLRAGGGVADLEPSLAPSLHGRAAASPPPPPPPAAPRPAQTRGVWLGQGQNDELARSVLPSSPHPPAKALDRAADDLANNSALAAAATPDVPPQAALREEASEGYREQAAKKAATGQSALTNENEAAHQTLQNRVQDLPAGAGNAPRDHRGNLDSLDGDGARPRVRSALKDEEATGKAAKRDERLNDNSADKNFAPPATVATQQPAAAAPIARSPPAAALETERDREVEACQAHVAAVDARRRREPSHLGAADERLRYARCLRILGVPDSAKRELVALQRETSDVTVRASIDRELQELGALEFVARRRAAPPSAASSSKAKKATPAKASSASDAFQ